MGLQASRIHLHFEKEAITCYTCPGMQNNTLCNKWAPDIPCPVASAVCKTVHVFSRADGESVSVTKMCALPKHCTEAHVGCNAVNNTEHISKQCVFQLLIAEVQIADFAQTFTAQPKWHESVKG
ncbi:hypothetical protein DPMN_056655 [Dreissena polymorpha]|uniref:Uncharacterized protein n=1 Tax=Dreissena polymorpha TaxID=45954 RepID=A0A9D4CTV4_DREPO|nr:hypothetical protein DPMN_056655 [Dreissena polymorpha]